MHIAAHPFFFAVVHYLVLLDILRHPLIEAAIVGIQRFSFYGDVALQLLGNLIAIQRTDMVRTCFAATLDDSKHRLFVVPRTLAARIVFL